MTQEQTYILMGRIEWLEMELRVCAKHNTTPSFKPDNEALYCGDYAEQICAYIRATNDKQVMIDCCKINRYYFYRYGKSDDDFSKSINKIGHYLYKIHDIALERIWGVSRADIENFTYYVNSYEGVCRKSENGDLLPLPEATDNGKQAEPQKQGLPREFDTPEARQLFNTMVEYEFMSVDGGVFRWVATASLFGYFVDVSSNFLGIRPSNGNKPWKKYKPIITNYETIVATAKQAVNDYDNKDLSKPEGYEKILNACK